MTSPLRFDHSHVSLIGVGGSFPGIVTPTEITFSTRASGDRHNLRGSWGQAEKLNTTDKLYLWGWEYLHITNKQHVINSSMAPATVRNVEPA